MPYRGSAIAYPDLISNKVQTIFDNLPGALEQVRGGTLRAIGGGTVPVPVGGGVDPVCGPILCKRDFRSIFGFCCSAIVRCDSTCPGAHVST